MSQVAIFEIVQDHSGMYTASSSDFPGVCICHHDVDAIIDDIPNVMKLWFRRIKNMDIEVFHGAIQRTDHTSKLPVIPVPAEIAAAALAR